MNENTHTKPTAGKVLVVDDNPKNIQLVASILQDYDYDIYFAESGEKAISQARMFEFDIILLDIVMPELNGFDVCRILKNDNTLRDVPIIFITAQDDSENISKAFEYGAVDYITKPMKPVELLARVKTHIELKRKTEEFKQLNLMLENKVSERTRELENANKQLSRLNKAKTDFMTLINHELRTPLNGIIGFSSILESSLQSPEDLEFVKHINESAERLLELSKATLLITSLQADAYSKSIGIVDIKKLLYEIIYCEQENIENKKISIQLQLADNLAIKGDEALLSYMFRMIMRNAVKYSPVQETIQIATSSKNDILKIIISDNGPGFSANAMEQLFHFFSTNELKHHSDGLGLGLATAKLIADSHQAEIQIYNKEGKGATVSIIFSNYTSA